MSFDRSLAWVPSLEDVIQRNPLIISPEAPMREVIALISQRHQTVCGLSQNEADYSEGPLVHASCVLVTEAGRILGIVTERDVVRLTSQIADSVTDVWARPVSEVMVHPVITLSEQAVQDIFAALFLFRRYRIRHVPIVDGQDKLVGVISHESIRRVLRPANLLHFRRVADVMTKDVVQAPLTASIQLLTQQMVTHQVSCVVITQRDDEDVNQPVGIVTERDIVQFQFLGIDFGSTPAAMVMSSPLFLLSPNDSLSVAHREMQKRRVGRLVVSWNWGRGLGIVTQTSVLRVFDPMEMYGVIENLQQTLQQLTSSPAEPSTSTTQMLEPSSAKADTCQAETEPAKTFQLASHDREQLLLAIDVVRDDMQQIVAHETLSAEQQRSQLRSVLNTLSQLRHRIDRA
ncbi:MAG: CBS domain-containing protein [Cyanobacteria bacterium J06638_20]